uniref:Uncharacterized protein n=1 Tax=Hemiselmis andersenii TaxID=464988 RepID=A0A7S0TKP5_HEMAN|mmetsp:Transcript_17278/g.39965  ORF Transcript_17278/g.39965 Transcript_17278/m.39965 type:complete len:464 (+) Transcript_17278:3-1394(+)
MGGWWEEEHPASETMLPSAAARRRPAISLGALVAAAAVLSCHWVPGAVGDDAAWRFPTPGCDSFNSRESCCERHWRSVRMGAQVSVSLGAHDPTAAGAGHPFPTTISLIPGESGPTNQSEGVCCGFSNFTNLVGSNTGNPAQLNTVWQTTRLDQITEDTVPTDYCAAYRASYNGGNDACTKYVCYKLCIPPRFFFIGSFLPFPSWAENGPNCGTGVGPGGSDIACLIQDPSNVNAPGGSIIVTYLQVSETPVSDPSAPFPLGVRVGETYTFSINIVCPDSTGVIEILAIEDPGVPLGLEASPTSRSCAGAGVSACRTVTFTPRKGLAGTMHEARFVARNTPAGGICDPVESEVLVVRLPVAKPFISFTLPQTEARFKEVPIGAVYEDDLVCDGDNYDGEVRFLNMSFNGVTRPGSPPPTLLTPPSTTASLAGGGGCACPRASRVAAPVKKHGRSTESDSERVG